MAILKGLQEDIKLTRLQAPDSFAYLEYASHCIFDGIVVVMPFNFVFLKKKSILKAIRSFFGSIKEQYSVVFSSKGAKDLLLMKAVVFVVKQLYNDAGL
jgi:hypothetical protein